MLAGDHQKANLNLFEIDLVQRIASTSNPIHSLFRACYRAFGRLGRRADDQGENHRRSLTQRADGDRRHVGARHGGSVRHQGE